MPITPAADSRNPLLDLAQSQHGDMQPTRRRGRDPADYAAAGWRLRVSDSTLVSSR
jgi:hypothetical protein